MKIETVKDILVDQIRDLYDAEKLLVRTLPKMAKNANSEDLKEAIEEHLQETENHVIRLEQVFEHLGEQAKSKPCQGMRGLIEEGKEVMEEDASEACHDLGIIAAAQRVEHYEISAYGTARTLAERLGKDDISSLLQETLDEEKQADEKLTEITTPLLEQISSDGEMEMEESEEERPARKSVASSGRAKHGNGRRAAR